MAAHLSLSPHLDKCIQEWKEKAELRDVWRWDHWQSSVCCHLTVPILSVGIRFDILDQEMKTLKAQIDGVNLAANNLMESGHPRSREVKTYQDSLNTRWGVGRAWGWEDFLPTPQIQATCHALPRLHPAVGWALSSQSYS